MEEKIRKMEETPESAPEPSPTITPSMIKNTLDALESKGMVYYMGGAAYVPTEYGWRLLAKIKEAKDEIVAYGSLKISATNNNMLKIIKSEDSLKDADAIVAVKADKSCKDLKIDLKNALKEAKKVEITIECGGENDVIIAYGSPALRFSSAEEIVVRKDDFIDGRTVAILADKSANELKQDLVEKLRNPNAIVKITLMVK